MKQTSEHITTASKKDGTRLAFGPVLPAVHSPVILDLFACGGIAGDGYSQAGFDVIAIDIEDHPNNPHHFYQMDWREGLEKFVHLVDAIHASPPCQGYSRTKSLHSNEYDKLLEEVREALEETGKPYIIENVQGAPMQSPIILDGLMFGLKVVRKRLFESNCFLMMPGKGAKRGSVGGKNCTRETFNGYYIVGGHQMGTVAEWKMAMGVDADREVSREELAEAIPPAYTRFLGEQLLRSLHCR